SPGGFVVDSQAGPSRARVGYAAPRIPAPHARDGVPRVTREIDATPPQRDPFALQQDALRDHARGPRAPADPALRVDDAMPRHARRTPSHRATDGARRPRSTEQRSDLSVRDHTSR